MRPFTAIEQLVRERHGEVYDVAGRIIPPLPDEEIKAIRDDRWLSELTRVIFQLGFKWSLIDQKWSNFETAFVEFDLATCAHFSDEHLEHSLNTGGIVRNWPKVKAVRANAQWLSSLTEEFGSVGNFFAGWHSEHFCENILRVTKSGSKLGPKTAQIWLRRMGVDTFVLTSDVVSALRRETAVHKLPGSKRDWGELQKVLNVWLQQTGKSLNYLSQMLALSYGCIIEQ